VERNELRGLPRGLRNQKGRVLLALRKCLNREEFVVVGWTDREGSRPHLGALLLAYYALTAVWFTPAGLGPA
jgi:hypothetical protein